MGSCAGATDRLHRPTTFKNSITWMTTAAARLAISAARTRARIDARLKPSLPEFEDEPAADGCAWQLEPKRARRRRVAKPRHAAAIAVAAAVRRATAAARTRRACQRRHHRCRREAAASSCERSQLVLVPGGKRTNTVDRDEKNKKQRQYVAGHAQQTRKRESYDCKRQHPRYTNINIRHATPTHDLLTHTRAAH